MDLPSLSKLSLSELDRIQAQVGAGCDDDPFTEIACDVKLAEWKKWIEQKLRDTVESATAILNEYHAAGVTAWADGKGLELSRAQQDLWVKMAARVQVTELWPQLGFKNWFQEYTYMKAVALAWMLRHNTGEMRVGMSILPNFARLTFHEDPTSAKRDIENVYVDWIAQEAREFEAEQEKRRAARAAAARQLEAEKRAAAAAADLARHVAAKVPRVDPPLNKAIGRVQRLMFGNLFELGDVIGVANIQACLALVAALTEPGGRAEGQLFDFLGVERFAELEALKDRSRMFFAVLAPIAYKLLDCPGGAVAKEKVASLGAEMIPLPETTTIESLINDKIRDPLDMYEKGADGTYLKDAYGKKVPDDIFDEGAIHDPSGDDNFVLAMVTAERIKLSWKAEFIELGIMDFYGSSGRVKPANFCGDTRVLPYLRGTVFSAVAIEAEPEGDNQRSMILVLPNDDYTVDQSIAELADKYATKTAQWFSGTKVELRYPKMKALFGPDDIITPLKRFVTDIFNEWAKPFDFSMPTKKLKEADPSAMGGVSVTTVLHYASFEADHKGAEAKAATVAVATYRSLSAEEPTEPIEFHCTKPFGVILIDGPVRGDFSVEFVSKIDAKNVQ